MIKIAKLVSHEFVIGRYVDTLLTNVALITFNANTMTGEQGIKIVPYMHPVTSSLAKIIPVEKVIYMEDAPPQLQGSYLEMIKTILEKAQENINDGQNGVHGTNQTAPSEAEGETSVPE